MWANNSATPIERLPRVQGARAPDRRGSARLQRSSGCISPRPAADAAFGDDFFKAALAHYYSYPSAPCSFDQYDTGNGSAVWLVQREFDCRTSP